MDERPTLPLGETRRTRKKCREMELRQGTMTKQRPVLQRAYGSLMRSLCMQAYCISMNHDRIIMPSRDGLTSAKAAGPEVVPRFRTDSRFHLTVIATTREGTLAALKTAATLSKSIGAPITLAMIEVLRLNLPLDLPRFMIEFFEQRAFALISDAGIRDQEVTVQIWFCRDRKKGLRQALSSQTLAVVGGTRHWFRRDEQRLEAWLCRQGYPAIFADAEAKTVTEMLPIPHRHAILHRVVKNPNKQAVLPGAD
jgi:hypothetical protein